MHPIDAKLAELNITLPQPPKPVASYVPAVVTGNHVVISGQLPFRDGELVATGPAPSAVDEATAQDAARQCAINALAVLHREIGGDWSRLRKIVRLGVFVQSDDGFGGQPQIANGASDLLGELFGDIGRHARTAVGVNALPLNATVEVEMTAEIQAG